MKRAALLVPVLALGLAACGGNRDESTVAASPGASSSGSSAAAPTAAPTSAAPTPSTPAAAKQCPLTPKPVPGDAGVSADLTQKPTVAASSAPPPTETTVADVVVGTGQEATTLASVEVKYVGALYATGEEFDSSWSRGADETLPFTVCANGTIPGFAIAPLGMKVGGRRVVTIPAELGYGAQGSPPKIPANAPLVFVIDLVTVTPPAG